MEVQHGNSIRILINFNRSLICGDLKILPMEINLGIT
jgi:hypothetical protein